MAPDFNVFGGMISSLRNGSIAPKILKLERYELRDTTLVEKQAKVLWLALKMGFFDYPKRSAS